MFSITSLNFTERHYVVTEESSAGDFSTHSEGVFLNYPTITLSAPLHLCMLRLWILSSSHSVVWKVHFTWSLICRCSTGIVGHVCALSITFPHMVEMTRVHRHLLWIVDWICILDMYSGCALEVIKVLRIGITMLCT
jgi:hypothetical protein